MNGEPNSFRSQKAPTSPRARSPMILRSLLVGGRCACLVLALSPAAAQAATHGHARRQTGTLRVVVSGLARGVRSDVVVIGPHARRFVLTRSTLLSSLGPGPYRVQV